MSEPLDPQAPIVADDIPTAVEVSGKKMVDLDALIAERRKGQEKADKLTAAWEKEKADLTAKASQVDKLAADIDAMRPDLEFLQQHPDIRQKHQAPNPADQVSNEEAEATARDYELYTGNGLDIARAKRIILKEREKTKQIATAAAQQAVAPALQQTAQGQARGNFVWAAQQKDSSGRPLADPQILASLWSTVPPELAANPEVAKHLLKTAIGETHLQGKQPPAAASHEPIYSEPSGGNREPYTMSTMEKKVAGLAGIKHDDWQKKAAEYKPNEINVIGD